MDNILILALILIIIMFFLCKNIFDKCNRDSLGNELNFYNTCQNIFGLYDDNQSDYNLDYKLELNNIKPKKSKIKRRQKEVYNINMNDYTYTEAPLVCEALGGKLATYDQLLKAHKKGANWCNYGWSTNQMALFPIQKKIWKKIQNGPEDSKNTCGKPGVNGGYFNNKNIKFGVNCFGYKPIPDKSKIVYTNNKELINDNKDHIKRKDILYKFKKLVLNKKIDIKPFNNEKWSKYSYKKSIYISNPEYIPDLSGNKNIIIESEIEEDDKDPNKLEI